MLAFLYFYITLNLHNIVNKKPGLGVALINAYIYVCVHRGLTILSLIIS